MHLTGDRCWRSDYMALLAECRSALANVAPEVMAEQQILRANPAHAASLPAIPAAASPIPVARLP